MTNFQSDTDKKFLLQQLLKEQRFDGRNFLDNRSMKVLFGFQSGSVQLFMGNTHVIAKTTSEIVEPKLEKPSEGFLKFNVDLQVLQEEQDKNFQTSKNYQTEISKLVERIIKDSKAIDTESLCLISNKRVWSITVDSTVINNDGNLIDAIFLVSMISLLHFKKPSVKIESQDQLIIYNENQKKYQSLSIHHIPLTFTYNLFSNGQAIVADALQVEEGISEGRVTIAMNIYQDVCSIHKPGGAPIDPNHLQLLIQTSGKKVNQMTNFIREILKQCDQHTILNQKQEGQFTILDFPSIKYQYNQIADNMENMEEEQKLEESQEQMQINMDELRNQLENRH